MLRPVPFACTAPTEARCGVGGCAHSPLRLEIAHRSPPPRALRAEGVALPSARRSARESQSRICSQETRPPRGVRRHAALSVVPWLRCESLPFCRQGDASLRVRKRRHSTLRTRRAAPLVAGVREKGESRIPTAWRCARSPTHLPAREPRRRLRIRDEETRSDGEDRKRERGTVTAPVRKRTEELVEPGQEGSEPRTDLESHPSGILGPMQIRHGSPPAHTESRGRD